jgi:hypothetical protein
VHVARMYVASTLLSFLCKLNVLDVWMVDVAELSSLLSF